MAKEMIRIRLKAYDHQVIDQSAEKIVETAKLAALLMMRYNVPLRNVVPHNYWSGKNCPAPLMTGAGQFLPDQ